MTMTPRSRNLLHQSKLQDFIAYCESLGWKCEPNRDNEVLRMRHKDNRHPLIVYQQIGAEQHFTTWGTSESLARQFVRSRKQ